VSGDEQIQALSVAVTNTDKARRVGWARAYSAEESRDELARDVNMLRAERDIMRRAWSVTFGFIQVYAPPQAVERIAKQAKAMGALANTSAVKAGRILARQAMAEDQERLQREAAKERARRDRMKDHTREFRAARQQERKKLIQKYGFPNEAAFLNYLALYVPEARRET
jgi:6-phosphofructokinase